jgi:predicted ArsR family transcriptional regulator
MTKTKGTVNARILKALQSGWDFTADQLRARFGIRDVGNRITELRKAGYAIYLNTKKTSDGRTIRVYRLGNPTRLQVAAGHALLNDPVLDWYRSEFFSREIAENLAYAR